VPCHGVSDYIFVLMGYLPKSKGHDFCLWYKLACNS